MAVQECHSSLVFCNWSQTDKHHSQGHCQSNLLNHWLKLSHCQGWSILHTAKVFLDVHQYALFYNVFGSNKAQCCEAEFIQLAFKWFQLVHMRALWEKRKQKYTTCRNNYVYLLTYSLRSSKCQMEEPQMRIVYIPLSNNVFFHFSREVNPQSALNASEVTTGVLSLRSLAECDCLPLAEALQLSATHLNLLWMLCRMRGAAIWMCVERDALRNPAQGSCSPQVFNTCLPQP